MRLHISWPVAGYWSVYVCAGVWNVPTSHTSYSFDGSLSTKYFNQVSQDSSITYNFGTAKARSAVG